MKDQKCNIILVDDHKLFRNGLKGLLNYTGLFSQIREANDGLEFLELIDQTVPDIVMLDIDMPRMSGPEAAAIALQKYPELKIITLSMHGEEDYYFKTVSLGIKGFLLKSSDIDEVVSAIKTVVAGGTYFSQDLLKSLVTSLRYSAKDDKGNEALSERELEILLLICHGLSNQEIAEKLYISKRTVDKHRANILAKTNCKNTANLVVYAIKNFLVEI